MLTSVLDDYMHYLWGDGLDNLHAKGDSECTCLRCQPVRYMTEVLYMGFMYQFAIYVWDNDDVSDMMFQDKNKVLLT